MCNNVNNNKIHFLSETKKEIISVIFKRLYNLAILISELSRNGNILNVNRSIKNACICRRRKDNSNKFAACWYKHIYSSVEREVAMHIFEIHN